MLTIIKANVTNTRNDGFIYSGNDIALTTGTLINTKGNYCSQ